VNGRPSLSALVACAPLYRPSKKEKKKKKNHITSAVLETEKIQCCPSVLIWHRDVIFLSASRAGKWNKLQREGKCVSVGQMGVQKSQTSQTTTNSLWLALLAAALHLLLLSDPHMCVPTFCHKRKACDQWTFY
jgi:hypothetical protein